VLASAVGIAFASSELFGVSFALGAFFAGMVLAEHADLGERQPERHPQAVLGRPVMAGALHRLAAERGREGLASSSG
jgi:hypothetical protein